MKDDLWPSWVWDTAPALGMKVLGKAFKDLTVYSGDDTSDLRNPAESGYQLILANNRDEYIKRPTKPANWWPDHPNCISGLDEEPGREGGTWMGLSTQGKVGILLNILQNSLPDKSKKGRGSFVSDFIKSSQDAKAFVAPLPHERDAYNGFNLILLEYDREESRWRTTYYSNMDMETPAPIQEEVFGFGNATLTNEWNKVQQGKQRFSSIIQQPQSTTELTDSLLQLLKDETQHWPDERLAKQGEGYLTPQLMQQRSAVYVSSPHISYGTRTHTVVIIDKHGQGTYTESTMREPIDPSNPQWHTQTFSFSLS